jgi:hypothetical protein
MNPVSLKAETISMAVFRFSKLNEASRNFAKLMTGILKEDKSCATVTRQRVFDVVRAARSGLRQSMV